MDVYDEVDRRETDAGEQNVYKTWIVTSQRRC